MRMLIISTAALAAASSANAGDLEKTPSGFDYSFVGCARPAEPDMTIDPKLAGPKLRAAQNARVKAYNVYIDGLNAYSECLAAEARADLEAIYAVVTAALDAEQEAMAERADALRPKRGARK